MRNERPSVAEKDLGIEALRAIAVLMVVEFHIGYAPRLGGPTSIYAHLADSFSLIHIPLFTVVAGYVHGLRPYKKGTAAVFLKGKAQRLLIPLVTVSTLQYLIEAYAPGVSDPPRLRDMWEIYVFPYSHFWYLQSLFLVFVAASVLEETRSFATIGRWLVVLGFAVVAGVFRTGNTLFSVSGALFILPYFILGVGLCRYERHALSRPVVMVSIVGAAAGWLVYQLGWYGVFDVDVGRHAWLSLVIGFLTCVSLVGVRRVMPAWLARLGAFAYSIYLFQHIGGAVARKASEWVGLEPAFIHFAIVMSGAVLAGIVVQWFCDRVDLAGRLVLGRRPAPQTSLP